MRFNRFGTPVVGLGKRWLNDERHIFQAPDAQGKWNIVDQHGIVIAPGGAAYLAANAGKWADTTGAMRSNFGYDNGNGKVWDIGFDGLIVESPSAFEGNRIGIWKAPLSYVSGALADARADHAGGFVACFYSRRIYSSKAGGRGEAVLPVGVTPFSAMVFEDFLLYHTHRWLVLQRFGSPTGRIIAEAPTFSPDMVWLGNGTLRIGWCVNVAETPESYRSLDVRLGEGFVDLSSLSDASPIPVPPKPTPPQPPSQEPPVMDVPDRSDFAAFFLGSQLLRYEGDEERTRAHSFELLNALCVELRKEDTRWGLLEKKGGARVKNRAADILAYDIGNETCQLLDVISNSEGWKDPDDPNHDPMPKPDWRHIPEEHEGIRPISQWKEPYPIGAPQPEPEPVPAPEPPSDEIAGLKRELAVLRGEMDALKETAVRYGAPLSIRTDSGFALCAEGGGGDEVNATRTEVGAWETFKLERQG